MEFRASVSVSVARVNQALVDMRLLTVCTRSNRQGKKYLLPTVSYVFIAIGIV